MTLPDIHRLLVEAAMHEDQGRAAQAVALYEQVLAREPGRPNTWFNLARQLRRLGEPMAALQAYDRALAQRISGPEEVHLNRGVIFSDDLRDAEQAERAWRAALALDPRYVPAWLNLANLHEDRGERAQALQAYERLLQLAPNHHEALARFASLRGISGPTDPLLQRLKAAALGPQSSASGKASLLFAMGKLLDEVGAYPAAFEAYRQANQYSRASAPPGTPAYDRAAQARLVDRLIQAFPTPLPGAPVQAGPQPVFVCGMFRSGSTLTEQVLAAHPQVRAGGELRFIPDWVATQLQPYPEAVAAVPADVWANVAARYQRVLNEVGQGAQVVTDKRPDNFLHLGLIKALFPQARIVHTTRNAVDNALSIYFLHLDHGMAYATDLEDIAHYHGQYRRLMQHWQKLFGQDLLAFAYDDFVHAPRPQTERLLDFCGLPWNEACLNFHQATNMVRTASAWQVRRPLFSTSVGRHRHYAAHLGPLIKALDESAPEAH